jgi:hypothetical protein
MSGSGEIMGKGWSGLHVAKIPFNPHPTPSFVPCIVPSRTINIFSFFLAKNVLILRVYLPADNRQVNRLKRACLQHLNINNQFNFKRGIRMQKLFLVLAGVASIQVMVASQTVEIYTDASPNLVAEWTNGGTFTAGSTSDKFEGAKCIEYSYNVAQTNKDPMELGLRSSTTLYHTYFPGDEYKYIQFAAKATTPDNISKAAISFWCIHCIGNTDTHFDVRDSFNLTTSWQVFSFPMSDWIKAGGPLQKVSVMTLWFSCNKGAATKDGKIFLDDVKFTNNAPVPVVQRQQPNAPGTNAQLVLTKGGMVKIDTYALNGGVIASRTVAVTANTTYQLSQYTAKDLPAGAYVIRQSLLTGAAATKLCADRVMVVRR